MKKQVLYSIILLILLNYKIEAQTDLLLSKVSYELDFRFRTEQDWSSKKSDGNLREDRTRLRYRLRTGVTFKNEWYSLGFRIRTGDQNKQQDPQLTIGKGFEEFGTLPLGFEKIFFQGIHGGLKYWLGKNSYSFEKNNELFWSDNVFPEGVFLEHNLKLSNLIFENIILRGSHYILSSNGKSFFKDAYFQGIQSSIIFKDERFKMFPGIYNLRNIPNIPDGNHSFELDYSIIHIGAKLKALKSKNLFVDFDFYQNIEDYRSNENISDAFSEEKTGYSIGIQFGSFKHTKDLKFKITYAKLEKYAALDYMAQNDWARWDYSAFNSPDGRLTNFKGIEIVIGYNITKKINVIAKYYNIKQIIPTGEFKETGQRIRFDLNVKI
ncbi:MAG: hypothetical protein P8H42_06690 [Saprospiraceae bacterium]|nr:hypothetical protein [Saprospiraceae bacterium]MDG1717301.1 hypothetical protein [Saprospiraceae bacterium]